MAGQHLNLFCRQATPHEIGNKCNAKRMKIEYPIGSLCRYFGGRQVDRQHIGCSLIPRAGPNALRWLKTIAKPGRHDTRECIGNWLHPRGKQYCEVIWTPIVHIKTPADLDEWLDAVQALDKNEQATIRKSTDAVLGCVVLSDVLILVEAKKPRDKQNWQSVIDALQKLHKRALNLKWGYLAACALKSEINVYGEYLKNVKACEPRVKEYTSDNKNTEQDVSLVAGMYGKMLAGTGSLDDAIPWLESAISVPISGLEHNQMLNFLAATKCYMPSNPKRAVQLAEQAATIAESSNTMPDLEVVKANGELAIAILGLQPTQATALSTYAPWSKAAQRFFRIKERDDHWKDLCVVFGHVQSYIVVLATSGAPPASTFAGDVFAAPVQGSFLQENPARLEYYRPNMIPSMKWILSQFARSAGDEQGAISWLEQASDEVTN
jgi:hypothetical protein